MTPIGANGFGRCDRRAQSGERIKAEAARQEGLLPDGRAVGVRDLLGDRGGPRDRDYRDLSLQARSAHRLLEIGARASVSLGRRQPPNLALQRTLPRRRFLVS